MKKTIAIAVVVIILMVALVLSVLWAVDVVNSLGANGTQDTIGTTEVVSPETPGVTDASYFNFTAKTMQNDNKETVTYYTVSAKSVENLPEILVIPSEYNGCEVRYIDTEGFAGAKVKKVYIPENIKFIMPNSFQGCTELEEVIVTDTIPLSSDPDKDKSKITVLSMTEMFADIINKVYNYEEISSSFIN